MKRRALLAGILLMLAALIFAFARSSPPPPLQADFVRAVTNRMGEKFYQMTISNPMKGTVDVWNCGFELRIVTNGILTTTNTVTYIEPLAPRAMGLMLFPINKDNSRQAYIRFRIHDESWALLRQTRGWLKTRRWPTRAEVAPIREMFVNAAPE